MTEDSMIMSSQMSEIDGAILSIHVRNFFCHDNLEIKLNRNVNFIVGRNGSGKSAILTALVIGLGARAAATNRGTRLQSFIKKGCNSATIEIKIKNSSSSAYRHNVYGDVITIIRTLQASGGSSYKIKSASGEIISTKHDDISMICSFHDIQVDNPISVLNQDDARTFHAADSKKKYSLFRKATNMDAIESNYQNAINNCAKAKKIIGNKSQAFEELERDLNELRKRMAQLQSRDEIQSKVKQLENEFYWTEVADLELKLEEFKNSTVKHQGKLEKLVEQSNEQIAMNSKYEITIRNLSKSLDNLESQTASKDAELNRINSQYQDLRREFKWCMEELKKTHELHMQEDAKVNALTSEVNAAKNMTKANERHTLELNQKSLQELMAETIARRETLQNDHKQMGNALAHQQNQIESVMKNRRNLQGALGRISGQLNELNVRGKDNLAVYGRNMGALVEAIKKANSKGVFSEMPRGPIGSYLKVCDKKWTSALEHIIGGSVKSFCVNTAEDSRQLFRIMKEIYGNESKPTITTSKFYNKVHNVAQRAVQAPQGYQSALQCIQIDDPVVANYLIDSSSLETILMVPAHEEAINFAADASRVPRNCYKIVTLDQTEYFPTPNYRSYGGRGAPSKFLQVSTGDRRRQLQEEENSLKNDFRKIDAELKELNGEKDNFSKKELNLENQLKVLMQSENKIIKNLSKIEANLREAEGGHIKVLTEELKLAEQKLGELQEEESKLKQQKDELKAKSKEIEAEKNKVLKEKDSQSVKLNEELMQEQLNLERNKSEWDMTTRILREKRKQIDDLEEKLREQKILIDQKLREAEMLSPRIQKTRDISTVVAQMERIKLKLNSLKNNNYSKTEVAASLVAKENQYTSTQRLLQELSKLISSVEKTSIQHMNSAINIQSLIASRVQYCFQSILRIRGYSGSMEINTGTKVLEIRCTGRDSSSQRVVDSTSSLSGGERSYATVAFIMALWDCMELPFHFLDEFDVFMDNVNRKVTVELLLGHASGNPNRQFVFLTPQDTSTIKASDTVNIFRLADPVRSRQA